VRARVYARVRGLSLENASRCVMRHARRHPPPSGSRAFSSYPPQAFKRCCYAPLVRSPDPRKLDFQTVFGNFQNSRALFSRKEAPDFVLPRVGLASCVLLRRDELSFESSVWPPLGALSIKMHGLSKKLIAVSNESVDINYADLDRPESPPPVSSRRYAVLLVVPMKTHWRGSITSLRP
jgi:hypothetical protein